MKSHICTILLILALAGVLSPAMADTLAIPPAEPMPMTPEQPMPGDHPMPMDAAPAHTMPAEPMPMDAAPEPATGDAPQTTYSVEMPARGMTMEKVEDLFGSPLERMPPVGEPPITRWVYPDFVVVFEHKWVIDSVLTRGQPQPR